ncbi:hypothetical protein TSACC_2490 [Terrimicrobium sacchariphilum]|uniref:L,D-TPase catalytic domain-containing protein n=1 Tax=Terrimicrobium sacchariphilum TaxID=690879 RepID=A0A146G3P3_TERSA|nr:hypothetical protein [Terrimicrobium sacchariphilum]GAT32093.1 hypothetical protein TSACC_2490 [Terrimicrobium sacchariphilum]
MKRLLVVAAFLGALAFGTWWLLRQQRSAAVLPPKPRTLADALQAIEPTAGPRVRAFCKRAGVAYPPERLIFIANKKERRIDLLVAQEGRYRLVHSWPVLAASGGPGPKLREGDRQVPEGFYRFELLNPNSSFHLSLRVNYPNPEDIRRGAGEGITPAELGSDIMIHGGAVSIGCLAVGDPAVEEIFLLVARTGLDHAELLILPDERLTVMDDRPWVNDLYARLRERMGELDRR